MKIIVGRITRGDSRTCETAWSRESKTIRVTPRCILRESRRELEVTKRTTLHEGCSGSRLGLMSNWKCETKIGERRGKKARG